MTRQPHLRASDADRERAAALLREHWSTGRLSVEEFQSRLDACFEAKTYGELDTLLADLPGPDPYADLPVPAHPPARVPYPVPPSTELAPWRGPVASFLAATIIVWIVWIATGGGFPWPWIVTGAGAALLVGRAVSGDRSQHRHHE